MGWLWEALPFILGVLSGWTLACLSFHVGASAIARAVGSSSGRLNSPVTGSPYGPIPTGMTPALPVIFKSEAKEREIELQGFAEPFPDSIGK